ncbi:unnamed protein product [Cuscuta campestris]|uniref:Peptidase A1 domain-containing protein n=1 Tax=Cuscuta campestris TaxID=132261 RepID=A0A484LEF7_9ASTE|nr:unnamed protein product [Cuscuta campestris]
MVALETIEVLLGVFAFFCAQSHSFTVDIIHSHSLNSPFYNPSKSRAEYAKDTLLQSQSRIARMKRHAPNATLGIPGSATAKFATDVEYAIAYYAMNFSIGTPPVERFSAVDTGSDLTWIQCEPCRGICFPQDMPLFDPSMSSSYTRLPCDTPLCLGDGSYSCDTSTNLCRYDNGYMDASYTHGDLAYDTLIVGDTSFPNFVFGCGFNNSGTFAHLTTGIFGLSNGNISFIKQANIGRFMYCLPWYYEANVSTHIAFDSDAVIADPDGVVSTPMVDTEFGYWVTLENLSVGVKRCCASP